MKKNEYKKQNKFNNLIFVKDIPEKYDYITVYNFLNKFGKIQEIKPIFSPNQLFMKFIFILFKEERSKYYLQEYYSTKSSIIRFNKRIEDKLEEEEHQYTKQKCIELQEKIKNYSNLNSVKNKSQNLYFTNKKEWIESVIDIQNIIKKY